jgi:hypothetical protein
MKTAMQELMQWMEKNEFMVNKGFIEKINECLEKEKEQIINAYEDGKENQRDSITNIYNYIIGEFYYNQTYNL